MMNMEGIIYLHDHRDFSKQVKRSVFWRRMMKSKIMVVEDDKALLLLYKEELKAEGYEILSAGNGREAIQKLEEEKPDLIILDIVMPVMDGMEALGRIVRKYRKIPIIFHTSYPEYQQDFMSWAADAFVVKSADSGKLKETIRGLLEKDRSH